MLAESLRLAHETGALRTRDLKRVTVDTTVQLKAIIFPTDAKPERNQIGFLTDDEMSSARPCGSGRGL